MGFQILERYSNVRALGQGRRNLVRVVFRKAAEYCNHPFRMSQTEFEDLLEQLGKTLKPQTYNSYVITIRTFYKWKNNGEFPDFMKHVKLKRFRREDVVSKQILSETEVRALIQAADNPRDKAMVGVCWEGGFRIGELLSIIIESCEKTGTGYNLKVTGKTGTRVMPIVLTAPLLEMWLYNHPAKDNKQSPLWVRLHGNRYESIGTVGVDHMIKKLARRAGIQRNVHWHMLRHTQATFYARNNVNEEQMRKVFGWEKDSNMPSLYTHLTARDVEETVLALRGIKKAEKTVKTQTLEPRTCFRCGENNPFDADYCLKCGTTLTREKAEKAIHREEVLDAVCEFLKNPENLDKLIERREQLREKVGSEPSAQT
jgi:site-specific recombinase XerD/ribosomal protein L40E